MEGPKHNVDIQKIFIMLHVFQEFPRGKTQVFYLTTSCGLGRLSTLKVWHDGLSGGSSNAWYLSKITVEDLEDKRQ